MYTQENLRAITNTGNHGGNLYFYFNEDGSDVTAAGFFKDVRLSIGDVVQVYNGETIAEYQIDAKTGNDKTAVILRDVATIKEDLDDLGDQVQGIEAKLPSPPTAEGSYTLMCDVDSEGAAVYSWA